jgi:hypothetical protein
MPKKSLSVLTVILVLVAFGCDDDEVSAPSGNSPPSAYFTIFPDTGSASDVFTILPNAISDREDQADELRLRWDWENDGIWDLSTRGPAAQQVRYCTSGSWVIKLEVEDSDGLADTALQSLAVGGFRSGWSPVWSPFKFASERWVTAIAQFGGSLYVGARDAGVARCEGGSWTPLGGRALAFEVFDNQLIACDGRVRRLSGNSWVDLGAPQGNFTALGQYDNKLIAGGVAGGRPIVFSWDGSVWSQLGDSLFSTMLYSGIHAIAVHNGELFIGGNFNVVYGESDGHVAKWNGAEWIPMGPGGSSTVFALQSFGFDLIAAGDISQLGNVIAWTGQPGVWEDTGFEGSALALAVRGFELVAGGAKFPDTGLLSGWNGSTWRRLDDGLTGVSVDAIIFDGEGLIAGGRLFEVGGTRTDNIAVLRQ